MITAEPKPLLEIAQMLRGNKRVLNIGCAGCTAICLTGGQREVEELNGSLRRHFKGEKELVLLDGYTVERQCEAEFVAELDAVKDKYDAYLSMACGAGVQFVAARFPDKPVFPALNTVFIGVTRDVGWYEERCRSCGDCQLAYTAGICPIAMCAKSLFNGPCGGPSKDGKCEVGEEIPCAWCDIYARLKAQGRLENISTIKKPVSWKNQVQGVLVLDRYKKRHGK